MASSDRWLSLESNPDVINEYLLKLGIPPTWTCVDVYATDDESLATIPKPTIALFLLFPVTTKYEEAVKKEVEGQVEGGTDAGVFFIKQKIGNACGTIALIHGLANNITTLKPESGGIFLKFYEASKDLGPDERANVLDESKDFHEIHEVLAKEGQTQAPPREQKIDLHFVTFVQHDGTLYELDGRKPFPIAHGKTSQEKFLKDAVEVSKKFMEREPDNPNFTLIALAKA